MESKKTKWMTLVYLIATTRLAQACMYGECEISSDVDILKVFSFVFLTKVSCFIVLLSLST